MKSLDRRKFLVLGTGALTLALQQTTLPKAKNKASKRRRLLFNWDGSMIHCWGRTTLPNSEGPLTRAQFTSLVFTPIENTAVDAVFFSFGSGNVAEYQSNVLEWPGQADQFKFPNSKNWHSGLEVDPKDQYLNPKSLADAGHNPPAVIVEECHQRGMDAFASLRMNDIHDGQHPQDTWPNPELPSLKRQNPDWLLEGLDYWSALNYSQPQVRALKLKIIEEFFDRWDFDGIELDWLRHTVYFPRGTERDNGKHLTDFMRAIRQSLNQRASKRGRSIEIAVRIPERVDWCLEGGFEVPTWISEGLVDMLILGQGLTELPTLSEFRKLMGTHPLPIYPCLYAYGNGYRMSPDEVVRANAANLWRDGADGLYTFNWFSYGTWRKPLLKEIADPRRLARKDKNYALVQRFEPAPFEPGGDVFRYNTLLKAAPIPLELKREDGAKTVSIPVADDLASKTNRPQRAELWIGLDYSHTGDVLELSLNQKKLGPAEIDVAKHLCIVGPHLLIPPGNGMLSFPAEQDVDLTFQALKVDVPIDTLLTGQNQLAMKLKKRAPSAEKPLRVSRVELQLRF